MAPRCAIASVQNDLNLVLSWLWGNPTELASAHLLLLGSVILGLQTSVYRSTCLPHATVQDPHLDSWQLYVIQEATLPPRQRTMCPTIAESNIQPLYFTISSNILLLDLPPKPRNRRVRGFCLPCNGQRCGSALNSLLFTLGHLLFNSRNVKNREDLVHSTFAKKLRLHK